MPEFRTDVDFYEVLQVHPRASDEIIRKAYRTLMLERGHPDQGGDQEQAKLLNEAYAVLRDPERRAAYDRQRAARPDGDRGATTLVVCRRCGARNRVPPDLIGESRCGRCKTNFQEDRAAGGWGSLLAGAGRRLGVLRGPLGRRLAVVLLGLLVAATVLLALVQWLGASLPVAYLLDALGRKEAAVTVFARALEGRSGNWPARERWAALQLELDRPGEAARVLEGVVAGNPEQASAYALLGQAYEQQDRWLDASRVLQQAVSRKPDDAGARFLLGTALAHNQEWDPAAQQFQQVLQAEPGNPAALFNLGTVLAHLQRWEEAIAAYRAAAAADTGDTEALVKLGELYSLRQRWDEAAEALQQALQRRPQDPEGHYALAQVLVAQGKRREARLEYQQSLVAWERQPDRDRRPDVPEKMAHAQRMVQQLQSGS